MPTSLSVEAHTVAIASAAERMLAAHTRSGGAAKVSTCPAWTADHLLAHQAMVHRWAAANVRGEGQRPPITQTKVLAEVADLRGYLREGVDALLAALESAADDLKAMVFLNDTPPPRRFWARRQAHETTVHAVDALAAALGRVPTAEEADLPTLLAVDGIDELLCGFLTRGARTSPVYDGEEFSVAVQPTDADVRWTVQVGDGPLVAAVGQDRPADTTLTGTAAQLYLGLWNRGGEIVETGGRDVLSRWSRVRVRWG